MKKSIPSHSNRRIALAVAALLAVVLPLSARADESVGAGDRAAGPPVAASDPEAEPGDAEQLAAEPSDGGNLYTSELSDAEVERRFLHAPRALGPISIGFAESGRLFNGVQLPPGESWTVMRPDAAFGTLAVVEFVMAIARQVRADFPDAPPLRVNHMANEKGGYIRPHHSHQSGRDVDLGFYYRPGVQPAKLHGKRTRLMDLPANWALVKAIATLTDAQVILVDRTVQKALYDFALAKGEDPDWLHELFNKGPDSLLRHARGHRDHFHVRFYSARAQELGVRIQPLLAKVPEQNIIIHKVRRGDTLGGLARRYGSSVKLIQKANAMRVGTILRPGRTLEVPLRGPCTKCPLPPRVLVPPRRLPRAPVNS